MRRAVTDASPIRAAKLPAGLTFHDFYASLLISKGASVKVTQARLGHKSAVETLDTYGHLWPDDEDLSRQAVDTLMRARHSHPADRRESGYLEKAARKVPGGTAQS